MYKHFLAGIVMTGLLATALPTTTQARGHYYCGSCGTVERIDRRYEKDRHLGGGTVLGAIVGGALGNQVGKGDGRKAATIVGAVAGGAVGHRIEKDRRNGVEYYRVTVHMDRGGYVTVDQRDVGGLYRGDRVRVRGDYVEPL